MPSPQPTPIPREWELWARLHWFKVRVDNTLRHTLLAHGAIQPACLADELHVRRPT